MFKKLVAAHDGRELRRGIDTLKKRVEKHFGDADGPTLSRALVMKVVRRCELSYLSVYERTKRIADQVYEGAVELDWRADDVVAAFRR